MKIKRKIPWIIISLLIAVVLLVWALPTTPSEVQAIETTSESLIKVYETKIPYYEYLSDRARRSIRICFLGQVYEYGNDYNAIDNFFRLAFADDTRFHQVFLLVAYLNLSRNQLIFFYIHKDWLAQIEVAV